MALDKPNVLAIIPARGGSKGLPRKNILSARGKPLIAWTIEAALNAKCITRVILSSDDDEIIEIAVSYGCEVPFKRPAEISTDTSSSAEVVLHALDYLDESSRPDYIILLQPTSPLRTSEDIDNAFQLLKENNASSCASLSVVQKHPYLMYTVNDNSQIKPIFKKNNNLRRQDLPPIYILNGAIYIAKTEVIKNSNKFTTEDTIGYIMPQEKSLDIDSKEDLVLFNSTT